ncbi:MAG: protein translocase subunit SecD [Phycisphaerae bacterium]|nr:protein translocase subunit SecD [Phycisphaerae bacterium]
MSERDMWWKIVIVGSLVALAFASVWPLGDKMKFGIDLYGGYSLLYEIDDTGLSGTDRQKLSENVMKVLRERVDPKGVFNLVWRPVGHNRLEIQMPRPSEKVIEARRKYEHLQEQIRATILRRSDILRALSKTGADRERACDEVVRGIDKRAPLLESACQAYDNYKQVQADYDERIKQIENDNLSEAEVRAAIEKPAAERPAAFASLIRGIPKRQRLLDDAAKAWDEYQAALHPAQPAEAATQPAPTTQPADSDPGAVAAKNRAVAAAVAKVLDANVDPNELTDGATIDKVVELDELLDQQVAGLLATNLDIGRLQAVLDTKPGDEAREAKLKALTADYPSLASMIDDLSEQNDELRLKRRGEGRLEDPADLQRLLKGAGVLEFRILPDARGDPAQFDSYREDLTTRGPRPRPGEETYQWFEIEDPVYFLARDEDEKHLAREWDKIKRSSQHVVERFGDKYYVLAHIGEAYALTHRPGESDWSLRAARFTRDQNGRPAIGFSLDERGGSRFVVLTRQNKGRQLCIFLDDQAISSANIKSAIRTEGIIEGQFSPQEVQDMVKKLNAGSLPKKLKDPPISIRSIGPSLGAANRHAGLTAAKYGAICVAIFMLVYYFYAGGIAVVAVAFNILFIGAMMAAMGATLTLPGIAGLVLAIGMAVDANVLINERIREELARGTAMRMAIKLGYERAFRAILDSNVTTVLTCIILYMLGSEEIKGFGLTLGIGVFINIFTAYFVTRMFFELMAMISIPSVVIRYPIYAAVGIAAFGAALYGLGYWWNEEAMRERSVLMHFGQAIMEFGPAILGLLILMWLARTIHRAFQTGGKPRIPMLRLIGSPAVDWVGKRYYFFGLSLLFVVGGLALFFTSDRKNLYDIEFLGGVAAQIDLKEGSSFAQMDDAMKRQAAISERLAQSGATLRAYGEAMANATVSGEADDFVIHSPGVPAARLEPIIKAVLDDVLSTDDRQPIKYDDPAAETVSIRIKTSANINLDQMKAIATGALASRFTEAGEAIGSAQVQAVQMVGEQAKEGESFEIVTREASKEVVVSAIMETLQDEIDVQPALTFKLLHDQRAGGGKPYFPIDTENPRALGVPGMTEAEAHSIDLEGWQGGVAMVLDEIKPPQKVDVLANRLRAMRLQPEFEAYGWRESSVFGMTPATPGSDLYKRMLVVVVDENYPLYDEEGAISFPWERDLAEKEVQLLQAALQRQTSLRQITQFDKQVSGEAQMDAYLALALSWLVIIAYVWFRFGNIRWGLAAVIALIHDVIFAAGCIAATYYIADTPIGKALMLDKFRIDLGLVAALLTVIGYSVNDTIVVFDRIRENRGRMSEVTPKMVNDSVSQTLSRTVLTLLTSLISVFIMYVFGGPGLHGFTFVLFVGLAVGTYSSIGIASQFLIRRRALTVA